VVEGLPYGRTMKKIATSGGTVVPAILTLETCGYRVRELGGGLIEATKADETYVAEDPVTLLGLIKLVELRTWAWQASDDEIDSTLQRFGWTQG
jgi:hypothetical protein